MYTEENTVEKSREQVVLASDLPSDDLNLASWKLALPWGGGRPPACSKQSTLNPSFKMDMSWF